MPRRVFSGLSPKGTPAKGLPEASHSDGSFEDMFPFSGPKWSESQTHDKGLYQCLVQNTTKRSSGAMVNKTQIGS